MIQIAKNSNKNIFFLLQKYLHFKKSFYKHKRQNKHSFFSALENERNVQKRIIIFFQKNIYNFKQA